MIRTRYLVLLGTTTLAVLARVAFYYDAPPEAQTRLGSQRPLATDAVNAAALRSRTRDSRSRVTSAPRSVAPLAGDIATLDVSDALEIGEPQSVDEAAWWDATTEVIELGDPLDADDPTVGSNATSEVMELGELFDAADPTAWAGQEAPLMPREIGSLIDASSP